MRDVGRVHTSFLNRWPKAQHAAECSRYPRAVEELSRRLAREHAEPIDLLISTSSAAVKGLRAPGGREARLLCHARRGICGRRASSMRREWRWTPSGSGLKMFRSRLRAWDKETSDNVHIFVSNSDHIRTSIQEAYGRASRVIHPPVDTGFFIRRTPARDGCRGASAGAITNASTWLSAPRRKPRQNCSSSAPVHRRRFASTRASSDQAAKSHPFSRPALQPRRPQRHATRRGVHLPQSKTSASSPSKPRLRPPRRRFPRPERYRHRHRRQARRLLRRANLDAIAAAVQKCLALGDVSAACRANAEQFGIDRFERRRLTISSPRPCAAERHFGVSPINSLPFTAATGAVSPGRGSRLQASPPAAVRPSTSPT